MKVASTVRRGGKGTPCHAESPALLYTASDKDKKMFAYEYSRSEEILIEFLELKYLASNPSIVPHLIYREMALVCFRSNLRGQVTDIVRSALLELEKLDGMKRMTPEWDEMIKLRAKLY